MRPSATLAMANRIASRSATGIRVTTSLIKKNVDPHAAVITSNARNASTSGTGPGSGHRPSLKR